MKYIIIITLIGVAATMKSCVFSGCEQLNLSDEELEWFKCYKQGQTIYFRNQFDDVDTMLVANKRLYYSPCNKFELSDYQYQTASMRLNDKNNSNLAKNNRVQIYFTQEEKGKLSSKCFYIFDYSFWGGHNLEKELRDTILNLRHLRKEQVKCLVFEPKDDRSHDSSNDDLHTFFWNKELGLVKYIIHDTLEYELFRIE